MRTGESPPAYGADANKDHHGWHRGAPAWAFVVAGMALGVGFALTAIFDVSDGLPREILTALRPVQEETQGPGVMSHIHGPPTGVGRGIQLGLLALLLGGVPAAILGRVLAGRRGREKRWSGGWGNLFLAGFVFQLSSLTFTAFLLVLLLWFAGDHAAHNEDVLSFGGPLLLSSACSIWGLRAWRALQFQVDETQTRVTPYDRTG